MKFIILILAFISVTLGQDNSCKINVKNSVVMEGYYYGSEYGMSKDAPVYDSVNGVFIHALNDTGIEKTSMAVTNETIIVNNGFTGEKIESGWVWTLIEGTTFYIKTKLGGKEQPCQKIEGVKFQRLSNIFKQLKTLAMYPQTSPYICQGALGGVILTIQYKKGESMDEVIFINQLSNSSDANNKMKDKGFRPLQPGDKNMFDNPCKKTEVLVDYIAPNYFETLMLKRSFLKYYI